MEVFEAIRGRRSVRRYTDQPVSCELIDQILEAGTWAPSAKNIQPWRFIVVQGEHKDRLAEITRLVGEQMARDAVAIERELGYGTVTGYGTIKTAKIMHQAPYSSRSGMRRIPPGAKRQFVRTQSHCVFYPGP